MQSSESSLDIRPVGIDPSLHAKVISDFVAACGHDQTPMVDGIAARKSLEIIQAIHRASAEGVEIHLPLSDSGPG